MSSRKTGSIQFYFSVFFLNDNSNNVIKLSCMWVCGGGCWKAYIYECTISKECSRTSFNISLKRWQKSFHSYSLTRSFDTNKESHRTMKFFGGRQKAIGWWWRRRSKSRFKSGWLMCEKIKKSRLCVYEARWWHRESNDNKKNCI